MSSEKTDAAIGWRRESIFRPELSIGRSGTATGRPIALFPLSWTLMNFFLFAVVLSVAAFVSTVTYSRTASLIGVVKAVQAGVSVPSLAGGHVGVLQPRSGSRTPKEMSFAIVDKIGGPKGRASGAASGSSHTLRAPEVVAEFSLPAWIASSVEIGERVLLRLPKTELGSHSNFYGTITAFQRNGTAADPVRIEVAINDGQTVARLRADGLREGTALSAEFPEERHTLAFWILRPDPAQRGG